MLPPARRSSPTPAAAAATPSLRRAQSGSVGPNLDEALKGKDADFIKESIVDPNAEVASGFQPDIMPQDYGSQLDVEADRRPRSVPADG